jgi:diguanylate cyclase (GGDEF)-like protein
MRILLVDDNPALIQVMAGILAGTAQLQFATDGQQALARMRKDRPDLVLLDAEMPGMSGYDVCAAMQAEPQLAGVPVIFVTSHNSTEFEVRGLEAGAVDFIAKPVSPPLLLARVKTQLRIKRLTDALRDRASVDPLTGVPNRRSFDEALDREWKRRVRSGEALALLMLDVDHFKLFNDRYGHPAGDDCLRSIAQTLHGATLRPGDLVARIGGEEFAVLLPQTTRAGARDMASRILDAVGALDIAHEASPTAPQVTVSIGVATSEGPMLPSPSMPTADGALALLNAADQALYHAKAAGRARAWQRDIAVGSADGAPCEVCRWTMQRFKRAG